MNNPTITASGVIPALSCVKVSTTANTVVVCTSAADIVFGVTFGADTANGGVVTFQTSDTQLDIVTLRAGGNILAGDQLVPAAAGAVVSSATGQFIAMTAATSGQTLTAYKKKVGDSSNNGPAVYGSTRAATFLKDLIAGTDSLDIILLGDSNIGSALAGGYGYQSGISQALSNLNATCYGTALAPFIDRSPQNASRFYTTWRGTVSTIQKSADYKSGLMSTVGSATNAAAAPYSVWNPGTVLTSYGKSNTDGTLSGVTITGTGGQFQCSQANLQINQQVDIAGTFTVVGGQGTITGYTSPKTYYIIATNGNTTFTLSATYSGTAITTTAGTTTGLSFGSQADYNDWLYFDPTGTAGFAYKGTGINVDQTHPLAANTLSQKFRVRYGTVNGSTGAFLPNVYGGGSANALPRLLIGAPVPLAGTAGVATFSKYEGTFTATGKGHSANAIGYNTNGTVFSTGPGAFFCQSFYRPATKGFAVHSHAYQSGDDSARISLLVNDTSTTWLQYQLQEIRERQLDAGGSGRVMLFFSSGINGSDTPTIWTDAHTSMWNRYKAVWSSLGYPASDLTIVSVVGVQKDSGDNIGSGLTLIPVRAAANAMATASSDMTVVDIKALMSYNAMTNGTGSASYYQVFNGVPNNQTDITVHLSGGNVGITGPYTATSFPTPTTVVLTGASALAADGYWVGSKFAIGTMAINVTGANASGDISCTAMLPYLAVGQQVYLTGTTSSGGITGYVNPTAYYIRSVNAAQTSFTLSLTFGGALVGTSAGSLSGITFTYLNAPAYQDGIITKYVGSTATATVNQWPGGAPPTGHNVTYTMARTYPSDGYTVISQTILTALIS